MNVEEISSVSFKLRLGELTLGELRRRLAVFKGRPFDPDSALSDIDRAPPKLHRGTDGFLFRSVPIQSQLPRIRIAGAWIRYVPRQYERYFADLSMSWDEYLGSFSSKSRSTLRRKVRKFEKETGGAIRWRCYSTSDEMKEFHRLARSISAQSYQERLLDAGLPDEKEFRAAMVDAASNGKALGYLIFFHGEPAAYLYCGVENGIVGYNYLGYMPKFADLSPGTVLLYLAMQDLFGGRAQRVFDFTEGGDAGKHSQKRFFSTGSVRCADVYWLRLAPGNAAVALVHTFCDWSGEAMGGLLARLGVKNRVRQWIRRRASQQTPTSKPSS